MIGYYDKLVILLNNSSLIKEHREYYNTSECNFDFSNGPARVTSDELLLNEIIFSQF